MLTRLKSTLSTVTSTLQAVRELPGALNAIVDASSKVTSNGARLDRLKRDNDALQSLIETEIAYSIKLETERDELTAKLARYEAAEKWHQVTAGDGELPPEGAKVIYQYNNPNCAFEPKRIGFPLNAPVYRTYKWRFASSGDVPC